MHHVVNRIAERTDLLLSNLQCESHRIERVLYRLMRKRVLLMHTVLILSFQELIHLLLIPLDIETITSKDHES
jgi:hypothetical protein